MIKIYGIKNCDTIKKARAWLTEKGLEYQFHDFRKDGLERSLLENWVQELGLEILLNKRGTTWRRLPEDQKDTLTAQGAIDLLLEHPAMIKRPVFDFGDIRRVGFSRKDQEEIANHLFS
ncbi:MAG: ArsC family reductase [Emcibacter sp.]|nr:ArsC family reductase [Emcibacter sp.]